MGFGYDTTTPFAIPNWQSMTFGNWNNTATKEETFEEYQKRKDAELKKAAQKYAENKLLYEQKDEQIKTIQKEKDETDKILKKAKNGIVGENNVIMVKDNMTLAEYKKLPWWKKVKRQGWNFLKGTFKLATGFFGYETDPKTGESKWNCKKFLINAGIAVGCLALTAIPYVGPVIGYGLLASGVLAGGVEVGKGIIKTVNPKSVEEIDQGWEDIGAGVVIGVTSAMGVRGLGKAAQASAATSSAATTAATTSATAAAGSAATTAATTSATTAAASAATTASTAARTSGTMSRVGNIVSKAGKSLKNFGNDITVNAYKATRASAKSSLNAYRQDVAGMQKSWIPKSIRAYGKALGRTIPKLGKTKYEASKKAANEFIDSRLSQVSQRIAEIRQEVSTASGAAKTALRDECALLEREQALLNAQKADFNATVTESAFKEMRLNSKAKQEATFWEEAAAKLKNDGFVEITLPNGSKYKIQLNADKSNINALKDLSKRAKELSKQAEKLVSIRRSTLRKMAFRKDMKADVEAYTGTTRNSRLGRIYDTCKIQKGDITWKTPFKIGWDLINIPFKTWSWVQNSATSSFYKIFEVLFSSYEIDTYVLEGLLPAQTENGQVVKQKTMITKDMLPQIEKYQQEYADTLAQLKREQESLSVA